MRHHHHFTITALCVLLIAVALATHGVSAVQLSARGIDRSTAEALKGAAQASKVASELGAGVALPNNETGIAKSPKTAGNKTAPLNVTAQLNATAKAVAAVLSVAAQNVTKELAKNSTARDECKVCVDLLAAKDPATHCTSPSVKNAEECKAMFADLTAFENGRVLLPQPMLCAPVVAGGAAAPSAKAPATKAPANNGNGTSTPIGVPCPPLYKCSLAKKCPAMPTLAEVKPANGTQLSAKDKKAMEKESSKEEKEAQNCKLCLWVLGKMRDTLDEPCSHSVEKYAATFGFGKDPIPRCRALVERLATHKVNGVPGRLIQRGFGCVELEAGSNTRRQHTPCPDAVVCSHIDNCETNAAYDKKSTYYMPLFEDEYFSTKANPTECITGALSQKGDNSTAGGASEGASNSSSSASNATSSASNSPSSASNSTSSASNSTSSPAAPTASPAPASPKSATGKVAPTDAPAAPSSVKGVKGKAKKEDEADAAATAPAPPTPSSPAAALLEVTGDADAAAPEAPTAKKANATANSTAELLATPAPSAPVPAPVNKAKKDGAGAAPGGEALQPTAAPAGAAAPSAAPAAGGATAGAESDDEKLAAANAKWKKKHDHFVKTYQSYFSSDPEFRKVQVCLRKHSPPFPANDDTCDLCKSIVSSIIAKEDPCAVVAKKFPRRVLKCKRMLPILLSTDIGVTAKSELSFAYVNGETGIVTKADSPSPQLACSVVNACPRQAYGIVMKKSKAVVQKTVISNPQFF